MRTPFEKGRVYRRADIHARFGGQRQGGISTPSDESLILLITGRSGSRHGYDDHEDDQGVFHYFGEGQVGDMEFRAGNRAVRDHAADGRELHLFEQARRGHLRYRGQMICAGYEWVDGVTDTNGDPRRAIVFQLVAADGDGSPENHSIGDEEGIGTLAADLEALREAAHRPPEQETDPREARRKVYRRSAALRRYVRARAAGTCEGCGEEAPFKTSLGEPYLEPHHTRRLSDDGPDDPRWVIGLCPNCHARVHYATDGNEYNEGLKAKLASLEPGSE
jgi:5-methylcytosine-specific restriction enzyme A